MQRTTRPLAAALAALLASPWALPAQPPVDFRARFDGEATSARIPFEMASAKVHVEGVFDGGERAWLLLDSGANMSILDKSLADRLGLELRGGGSADGAAGGGSFRFAFARAPALSFPGVEIASRAVAVIIRKTQGANGHPSEGLLGADLFKGFVVDVDYPNRILTLHDPKTFAYSGPGVELPVTFNENDKWELATTLTVGDRRIPAKVIVDTGARGTLGLTAPFTQSHGLLDALPTKILGTVGVGIGGEVRHWVGRLDAIEIGGLTLESVPVTLAPEGVKGTYARDDRDGILGAEVLSRYRAIFDRSRARLILEPTANTPATPFEWDAAGLFLTSEGESFDVVRVLSVSAGSPAEAAGLDIGDRIVSIDGRPTSETSLDGVRALLRIPDQTYSLVVERDGNATEVTLVTRRLV